jgi:hypothetical protein
MLPVLEAGLGVRRNVRVRPPRCDAASVQQNERVGQFVDVIHGPRQHAA